MYLSFILFISRISRLSIVSFLAVGSWSLAFATSQFENTSQPLDKCILGAAQYHGVNPYLLRAILVVESRLNPKAINVNVNGTRDIGVAQINTIHLPTLQNHGINENKLMDGCVNTYVGAWLLRKQIARFGLNWYGIAAYHSTTPVKNYRYQVLVYNEMVRSGAIQNIAMDVPPLRK